MSTYNEVISEIEITRKKLKNIGYDYKNKNEKEYLSAKIKYLRGVLKEYNNSWMC